jgi:hypothetical protein
LRRAERNQSKEEKRRTGGSPRRSTARPDGGPQSCPSAYIKLARKGRKKRAWERTFLKILAGSGNITEAAEAVGLARMSLYAHRLRHPDFSQAWDSALETFADGIEQEAIRRAVKGVTRYKFYKGQAVLHPTLCECDHGKRSHEQGGRCQEEGCSCAQFQGQPYQEQEYSDALLALLLKGLRSDKYRENLGLAPEEIDAYLERRISELADERVNQIISRNGTAPPPPVTASQEMPLPDSSSARPPAAGPAEGPGTPDPSVFYSDRPPLLPPGFGAPPLA